MAEVSKQTPKAQASTNAIQGTQAQTGASPLAVTPLVPGLDNLQHVTPDQVVYLQRVAGNRAVANLLRTQSSTPIQAKLSVGPVGDKYEQ